MVAYAFDQLGVRRLTAGCFADNLASVRILEKVVHSRAVRAGGEERQPGSGLFGVVSDAVCPGQTRVGWDSRRVGIGRRQVLVEKVGLELCHGGKPGRVDEVRRIGGGCGVHRAGQIQHQRCGQCPRERPVWTVTQLGQHAGPPLLAVELSGWQVGCRPPPR